MKAVDTAANCGGEAGVAAHYADAPNRKGRQGHMKNVDDQRRETLEQLAAEGDACAVAELWQVYGVDRRSALS